MKWRFLDEETAGVAVSTYPQYGFNLLRSSSERGLADEDAHLLLPVSAVKSIGPVEMNLEAGRVFASGGEGQWVWGVALGHAFGSVEALAEAFGSTGDEAAARQVVINLGARVPVSAGSTILVSGGWSVSSGGRPAPRLCLRRPPAHTARKERHEIRRLRPRISRPRRRPPRGGPRCPATAS